MPTTDSQIGPSHTSINGHSEPANRPPDDLTIVGIAAAAGGLVPLRTFLAALPPDTGMTFVVVAHLAPDETSALPDQLRRAATLPVTQVRTRVALAHNHIYIIPPGKRVLVAAGHLGLAELEAMREQRLQIDGFFRTLAEEHGDGAAVILSGAGSDGAVGIRAIKDKGGLLLVQAPEEAEYDTMPRSTIATGLADAVAPAADLAALLVAAKRTQSQLTLPADAQKLSPTDQHTMVEILTQLRQQTGHDFGGYKETTILRRVGRRMQVVQVATLAEYRERLRRDAAEAEALSRDVLIHVTEFFRDAEAWEALAQIAIPQIFAGKAPGEPVRVWAAGCATGEEAYSVAMLLKEHAAKLDRRTEIQVFASGLGRTVLDFARTGVYPEAIAADVSPERLARFFVHARGNYRVRPELRESDQLLQTTRQGYQTSLEELRAANEELQSTNEEYRAAMEELEISSEQEERRRISALLHDDLQQRLFSLNMQLSIVRQLQEEGALDEANQVLEEISAALQEAVHVTCSLSVSLSPPVLHDEGLPEAIRWLAALMQQQHGLAVTFDPAAQAGETSSQGLQRAEQRLQLIGGRVQVESQPGAGTRVDIYAPLHTGTTGAGGAQTMNG